MTPQEVDVIVRVAGATLLLAATILLSGRDDRRNGLFFLPLALCLCGFLAGNTSDAALRLSGLAGQTAYLLSGFGAVFLWWFCLSVFDRTFRPRGLVLATGLAPKSDFTDKIEHAAWTSVCRVILNLHETITRY